MKSASFTIFLLSVIYLSVAQGDFPTRFHRSYFEILKRHSNFGEKVGIPLVVDGNKKSEIRIAGTTKDGGLETSADSSKSMRKELSHDKSAPGASKNDHDSDGDDEERQENDGNNKEEMGNGYENIGDMESGGDEDVESGQDKSGSGSDKQDETSGDTDDIESSGEVPDLSGEFPPRADQVFKLPKDIEISPDEVDKKILDKHKGYVNFAIRQRFKPEFKYKESSAYKILAGNVIHDVERVLKATGVVKDVLFREAKDVGGPPYHSKVQVYLRLKNATPKRLKKVVDHGLINGMIAVPGSFHVT